MTDIATILSRIDQGDPSAAGQLVPLVYDEHRSLAAAPAFLVAIRRKLVKKWWVKK